mmetsp:Transcript_35680/g.111640  ORF Transcript_35680/g.111640 Transcript_35680/m.111640 type:complete len:249 (-) Transcript_35680:349-1095(-)
MEQTRRRQSFSPYNDLDNRSKENKMEMLSNLHFEESVDSDKPRCPSRREQLLYEAEVWSTELKASKLSLSTAQERATKRASKTSSSRRARPPHLSFDVPPPRTAPAGTSYLNEETLHARRVKRLKKDADHDRVHPHANRQSQSPAVPHISLEKLQEDFKLARLEIRSAGSQRASCATPRPRCVSARGLLRCQTPRHDPEAMNQHRFLAVGSKVLPKRGARSEEAPPSRRELWGGHRWTPLTARDGRAR